MDGYAHAATLQTRFRDLDTNGHVNNAVYVSYVEQGRAEYFADVLGEPLDDAEVVLAELTVTYEAPIALGETVTVHTRVPEVGGSSFVMESVVESDGERAATAEATVVPFDRAAETSRPVPERWRERIRAHEGG